MNHYTATVGGKEIAVSVAQDGRISVADVSAPLQITRLDERSFSVLLDGRSIKVIATSIEGSVQTLVGGKQVDVVVESERRRLLKKYDQQKTTVHHRLEIHAPMPALIVKVEVAVGDEVVPGQGLLVLEAMKMENEIKAHQHGKVKEIRVTKGKAVEKGELLLLLE